MKTMQAREAKAHFAELLASAEQGEAVTITRHGQPVAMVVPFEQGAERYGAGAGKTLVDHLLAYPGGLDLERDHTPPREIDL